jgi:hypothetical protein
MPATINTGSHAGLPALIVTRWRPRRPAPCSIVIELTTIVGLRRIR